MPYPSLPPSPLRPDRLRWAICLCLFGPAAVLANPPLEPAPGPGGTASVNVVNGVPVVAIVPPNASGLSHNRYQAYNVGRQGVVLNNALAAGTSQLAKELQANPQFRGQAASTILNEVISRQASLIEGPQEIFGRPADYILANPNGITLNGGSFINTTHAAFLVGTPVIEDQRIQYFDTLQAEGALHMLQGGQSNLDGALDLITPRIETAGAVEVPGDLNVIIGRNRIERADHKVLEHLPGTPGSVDASLLGAMRAGRIRILSTAEGAGVRVGAANLLADESIDLRSAGDLQLTGTRGKARHITLDAGQKLVLGTETEERVNHAREAWDKKAWFIPTETYRHDTTHTDRTQQGARLQAVGDLSMQAGGDVQVTAAQLKAGDTLALRSEGETRIEAGRDTRHTEEQIRHRKHLWRGDRDTQHYRESASASSLEGGTLKVDARQNLHVTASKLHSEGDLSLHAQRVEVGEQLFNDSDHQRNYRGDLVSGTFFGDRQGNDSQGSQAVGSTLRAEGKLNVGADAMSIRGSSMTSAGDAVLYSEKAGLTVEAASSKRQSQQHANNSQVFGLLGSSSDGKTSTEEVLVSDVRSTTNLRLASADEMHIRGATLEAGQALELEAKGELHLDAAQATQRSELDTRQRGFTASAQQTQNAQDGKPDSRQFEAKVGYEVNSVAEQQASTGQVPSQLRGAHVALRSERRLSAKGAQLAASAGDLTLKAPKVELDAVQATESSSKVITASGGGLAVTGGIDRVGSAFEGHRNQARVSETTRIARGSALNAAGDLRIDTAHLVSEGASTDVAGKLLVSAERVDNKAAADSHEREQSSDNWKGSLGASVEYREITRPIERLVEGREAARFQQAGVEDAMAPPSVGADLAFEHLARTETDTTRTARPNSFNGEAVTVVAKRIQDEGTHYSATGGPVQIDAEHHQLLAASDERHHTLKRLDAGGGVRVDTSTGQDVNVRVEGKYGQLDEAQGTQTARPGSLMAKSGIQVQLGSDGRYEGTRIDAGKGAASFESKGELSLPAARDITTKRTSQTDASLWAKGGNRPGSTGVDVRAYADHASGTRQDTQAQVASIATKATVSLKSAGDMTLEGTRIDAPGDVDAHADGVLKVLPASGTHEANGATLGGGGEVAMTQGSGKGGGLGGHFTNAKVDEAARQAVNAQITSNAGVQLTSLAREDLALQVQGLQANAARIGLDARNGGLRVEASRAQDRRDNLDITAGAGFKLNRGETPDKDIRGLHGRAQVALDKRDNQTWNDSTLRAEQLTLNSAGDTHIEGARLTAERIGGKVGGDLLVASRKDQVNSLNVAADARLSQEKNPQGHLNAVNSLAGPAAGKVQEKAGSFVAKTEPGLSPTLEVDVSHQQRDTVTRQTALIGNQGIDLKVAGDTRLVGAKLQANQGKVDLGGSAVTRETLTGSDYRRDVSIDASNAPVDLGTAVFESFKSKGAAGGENALDLGLIRTSGHNRTSEMKASIDSQH